MKFPGILALLAISNAAAFAPIASNANAKTSTSLRASTTDQPNSVSKFFTASVASAILLSSSFATPDAIAAVDSLSSSSPIDFGSSQVVSARSGGRAGGRSSASSMRSAPSVRSSSATTTINRTTVIAAPAPVIAAPVVVSPFGYSPFGGFGYGALGAVSAIGNEMRDIRQENEIARERAELEVSKQRQAQLEQRLYELERNQAITNANVNAAVAK
mmetsp:Transcript_12439/g.23337  ORF Transcript_12439/g.23337 Transcript_12439/m.23337 type:complete len:216 (-) Transcript_12439:166-813(-)